MKISVDELVQMLLEKGTQCSVIDDEVMKFYEQIIKMLETEKGEYKKSIKEPGLRLKGGE